MDAKERDELSRQRDRLVLLLVEALQHLGRSHPPKGGETWRFIQKAKRVLRGH